MRLKFFILASALMFSFALNAVAQSAARETYTGTMVGIGRRRSVTRTFTLTITGRTPDRNVGAMSRFSPKPARMHY